MGRVVVVLLENCAPQVLQKWYPKGPTTMTLVLHDELASPLMNESTVDGGGQDDVQCRHLDDFHETENP